MSRLVRCSLLCLLAFACARLSAEPTEVASLRAKAERGNALAQYNLGLAYYQGQLVPADLPEAFAWLSLAAENGSTGKALDHVLGTITDQQLAAGRKRLEECRAAVAAHAPSTLPGRNPLRKPANRSFSLTPLAGAPSTPAADPAPATETIVLKSPGLTRPGEPAPDDLTQSRTENIQLKAELARAQVMIKEQSQTIAQLQDALALRPPAASNPDSPRPPSPSP